MARELRFESGLTKDQTRTSLESLNFNLILRGVFDTVCAGNTFVFVAFALSLGIPKESMGIVAAVTSIACIVQMVGLSFLRHVHDKKRYVVSLALAEPLLLAAAVLLIPLLPPALRIGALLLAVFMAAAFLHLTAPLTAEWVASTVPSELRGRFVGRRFQLQSVSLIATILLAGFVCDRVGTTNTSGLTWLLAAGSVFGVLAVWALAKATMPSASSDSAISLADIRDVVRYRPFVRYLGAILLFDAPFFFACPYYQVFYLEVLKMRPSTISYMATGYYIARILVSAVWGRYVERHGARRCISICAWIYLAFFMTYTVSGPGRIWPVMVGWAFVGVADAGWAVATTVVLYQILPTSRARPAYFAVQSICQIGLTGLGAFLAVPVLFMLKNASGSVGGLHLGQFHFFFLACAIALLPCMLSLRLLGESGIRARAPPAAER